MIFLAKSIFERLITKYFGNKSVKYFTCKKQRQCMLFGQLSSRKNLR
ncbi:DUF4372 domain-containing protein [Flavobacterium humidisoli]